MYPYAVNERVPIPMAMAIVVLGPVVVIAIYTMIIDGLFATGGGSFKKYSFKSRLWELNCGVLGLLLGVGSSFVITAALKNAIGKPRPDIIDRCRINPDIAAQFLVDGNYTLVTHSLCTQTDNHILKDGFRSFPSGHSSGEFGLHRWWAKS
jgi:diacylglycerol diphosphate phosphatase / phosphatidate phosphatase